MLTKQQDQRILEQYQLGNTAKKAQDYFEYWLNSKKEKLQRQLLAAKDEAELIPLWQRLKLLNEFEADLKRDIQTGELALDEMEED